MHFGLTLPFTRLISTNSETENGYLKLDGMIDDKNIIKMIENSYMTQQYNYITLYRTI